MNSINSLNEKNFTLNGIQYFRNYVSAVHGTKVEVYNCYERKDVLIPLAHFSEFSVNGSTYTSATTLQAALLDVTYSRLTGSDSSAFDQNNIGRTINVGNVGPAPTYVPVYSVAGAVSTKLNQMEIVITAKETPVIITASLLADSPDGTYVSKIYKYLFKPGKGNWGLNGTAVTSSHLEEINIRNYLVDDLLGQPNAVIENLGNIPNGDFIAKANTSDWNFYDLGTEGGAGEKTYYFSYEIEDVLYFAQFTGTPGLYGLSYDAKFTAADFISTTDSRITDIPNLEEILEQGGNISVSQLFNNGDGSSPFATVSETNGITITVNQAVAEMYLKNSAGLILATVNLGFLNNEGTTFFYNEVTQKLELKNDAGDILSEVPASAFVSNLIHSVEFNGSNASILEFKDATGNVVDSTAVTINNIQGLQAILNSKANSNGSNVVPMSNWNINVTSAGSAETWGDAYADLTSNGDNLQYMLGLNGINAKRYTSSSVKLWLAIAITDIVGLTARLTGIDNSIATKAHDANVIHKTGFLDETKIGNFILEGALSTRNISTDNGVQIQTDNTTSNIQGVNSDLNIAKNLTFNYYGGAVGVGRNPAAGVNLKLHVAGRIKIDSDAVEADDVPNLSQVQTMLSTKANIISTLTIKATIGDAENLNNYVTTGIYSQLSDVQAVSGTNYPVGRAGKLEVVNDGYIYQTYHVYGVFNTIYHRTMYNGTWSEWKEIAYDVNVLHKTGNETKSGNLDIEGVFGVKDLSFQQKVILDSSGNSIPNIQGANYDETDIKDISLQRHGGNVGIGKAPAGGTSLDVVGTTIIRGSGYISGELGVYKSGTAVPNINGQYVAVNYANDTLAGIIIGSTGSNSTFNPLKIHGYNGIDISKYAEFGDNVSYIKSPLTIPNGVASSEAINNSQLTSGLSNAANDVANNYISKSGTVTKNGTLTFADAPIVPAGTLSGHTVNVGQMTAAIFAATPALKTVNGNSLAGTGNVVVGDILNGGNIGNTSIGTIDNSSFSIKQNNASLISIISGGVNINTSGFSVAYNITMQPGRGIVSTGGAYITLGTTTATQRYGNTSNGTVATHTFESSGATNNIVVFEKTNVAVGGVRFDGRIYGANGAASNDFITVSQNNINIKQSGNSFGAPFLIGSLDSQTVTIMQNATPFCVVDDVSITLGRVNTNIPGDLIMSGAGEIEVTSINKGLILKSPNGTRYRITVSNTGVLTTIAV